MDRLFKPPDCVTAQVGGLYKGMSSPMAGVAVVNAIVFGVYGNFQRHWAQPDALSSHFLAGATAGLVQSFVCSPLELVKTRLQVQQKSAAPGGGYCGPINCLSQVTSLSPKLHVLPRFQFFRHVYPSQFLTLIHHVYYKCWLKFFFVRDYR
jgi:hypothetical protein